MVWPRFPPKFVGGSEVSQPRHLILMRPVERLPTLDALFPDPLKKVPLTAS
jgi:hypothetical protein